jgi:hypothetical protein
VGLAEENGLTKWLPPRSLGLDVQVLELSHSFRFHVAQSNSGAGDDKQLHRGQSQELKQNQTVFRFVLESGSALVLPELERAFLLETE